MTGKRNRFDPMDRPFFEYKTIHFLGPTIFGTGQFDTWSATFSPLDGPVSHVHFLFWAPKIVRTIVVMGVLRILKSKRRWWRKMKNRKLSTSGVLMSRFFEGLPLLYFSTYKSSISNHLDLTPVDPVTSFSTSCGQWKCWPGIESFHRNWLVLYSILITKE